LAAVALRRGQAEHPLLEDRVLAVPQGQGERQQLVAVAQPRDPVFAPPVRLAARLFVRQVAPRVAAGAVVLAHGSPGAFRHITAPASPRRDDGGGGISEALVFGGRSSFGWHVRGVLSACSPCAAIFLRTFLNSPALPSCY